MAAPNRDRSDDKSSHNLATVMVVVVLLAILIITILTITAIWNGPPIV